MTATKAEKCAHPVCSCLATSGKYCSAECEAMEKTPDIDCSCGHRTCTGNMRTMNSATIETPSRVYHRIKMRNFRRSFAMLTLFEGGNDYPVKETGVVSISVRGPAETKCVAEAITACLENGTRQR